MPNDRREARIGVNGTLTIDPFHNQYTVLAETGTTDNLDQIDGGYDGQTIKLYRGSTHTITVRDLNVSGGTGDNIHTATDASRVLDNDYDVQVLSRRATTWTEQSFTNAV